MITKTEARAEIKRRKLPDSDPRRKNYPRAEVMSAHTRDLKALAAVKTSRKPVAVKPVPPKRVADPVNQACQRFAEAVAADAPAGDYLRTKIRTYGEAKTAVAEGRATLRGGQLVIRAA